MLLTEHGIIYNNGKDIFPWELFFQVIREASNAKTEEKLKQLIRDRVDYNNMKFFQEYDVNRLNQIAQEVGLKTSSKSFKVIKGNIKTRIEKIAGVDTKVKDDG
jgi:hypothetical protein